MIPSRRYDELTPAAKTQIDLLINAAASVDPALAPQALGVALVAFRRQCQGTLTLGHVDDRGVAGRI